MMQSAGGRGNNSASCIGSVDTTEIHLPSTWPICAPVGPNRDVNFTIMTIGKYGEIIISSTADIPLSWGGVALMGYRL